MKIINEKPPMFDEIAAAFPLATRPGVVFSFGDRIYNPSGTPIPGPILVHEEIHGERQRKWSLGVENWWHYYITNARFRLEEEFPAHIAELGARVAGGNRHDRRAAVDQVARRLASPLYGGLISVTEAKATLRRVMAAALAEAA